MSQTYKAAPSTTNGRIEVRVDHTPERTAWTGWVVFAGAMMIVLGIFQFIEALTALFKDTYYLVASNGLLVTVNYNTWGWTHLVIGSVALLAGFALLAGRMWGRVLGVVVAAVSAIVNLAFVAAAPVWAVTVIAIDLIVIYAICVHGAELKS